MRSGALLLSTLVFLGVSSAPESAEAEQSTLLLVQHDQTEIQRLEMARRVGEACVFGAAAGAAGAMLAGAPAAVSAIGATGVVSVAVGAAALGCTVGFVGATAASGFRLLWKEKVEPTLAPEGSASADERRALPTSWPLDADLAGKLFWWQEPQLEAAPELVAICAQVEATRSCH